MANLLGYLKNKDNDKLFLDFAYPVGSIYLSMNSTSPQTLFGGTWVQIKDEFLYCTTTSKTTGGANSVSYKPSGSISVGNHYHGLGNGYAMYDMSHSTHQAKMRYKSGVNWESNWATSALSFSRPSTERYTMGDGVSLGGHTDSATPSGSFTGTSATINTMPKYMTCYAWYRTA